MGFRIRLRLPECRTLKDRRMRVEGLIQRAKRRHGFSAADLSDPLKVNYAEIGLAGVGRTESDLRKRLDRILAGLDDAGESDVLGVEEIGLGEEA